MDAGGEERLVGVDVADAGDGALVEEHGLDGRASVRQRLAQLGGGERGVERLRAEGADGLLGRFDEPHLAELAEVGVAQLAAVVEGDDGADVGVGRVAGVTVQEGAGHAQVDGEVEGRARAVESKAAGTCRDGRGRRCGGR